MSDTGQELQDKVKLPLTAYYSHHIGINFCQTVWPWMTSMRHSTF